MRCDDMNRFASLWISLAPARQPGKIPEFQVDLSPGCGLTMNSAGAAE
jgi:hypothetical protein